MNIGRVIAAVLMVFFLAGVVPGCGKKGDPVPPRIVLPASVTDLRAALVQGNIVLTWTLPARGVVIEKIKILRSELEIAGEDCPACPRRYMAMADFLSGDARISKEGDGRLRYVDFDLKPGWLYTYKVVICDSYGNCSKDSNVAETKVRE